MTPLTMGMHPNEETLSRLADQSELERMRSRAGRHVAHCDSCGAAIGAFHTLGDAARTIPESALPTALMARIVADRARARRRRWSHRAGHRWKWPRSR